MKAELDDLLCQRFPNLYRDRRGNPRETLMCFGFSCGDGWFNIVYMLSSALENLSTSFPELGDLRAMQVKEKFGGLRFYLNGVPTAPALRKIVDGVVRSAEYLSISTCEVCGQPGAKRDGGWVETLCDTHAGDRQKLESGDDL